MDDNISTTMTTGQYDQLVGDIYQGVLEDTPWQAFLPKLLALTNAKVVSLVLRPPADGDKGLIINCLRPDQDGDASDGDSTITLTLADPDDGPSLAYKEQFFSLDPFINLPEEQVVSLHELIPEAELLASDYYCNFLRPAGVFHILGADTRAEDGTLARLRLSRGPNEVAFAEAERQLCQQLLPHLRRAILLHARLNRIESERALYAGAIDRLSMATILLDENLRVLTSNTIANQLFEQKDGLQLIDQKLQLHNSQSNQQLYTLISDINDSQRSHTPGMVRAMRLPRPSGRADLGIVVRPVPQSMWAEGQATAAVALFISDPEQQFHTSQRALIELFNFTRAEASLTLLLTRGLTLAEASDELNISQHTARAQLKSIFAKSGVTRQAELIRLVVKSVADLA